jgi:hypothetical protein
LLLVVFAILVFGFLAWALADRFRGLSTGAKRLAFIASLAGGCAAGLQGVDEDPVVHGVAWGVAASLAALTAYAKWRERERDRLTRGSQI